MSDDEELRVDEGNHPRRGSITKYPKEIEQVFLDIRCWYDENAKDLMEDIQGASKKRIESFKDAFDEIPMTLIKLLKIFDGGIYFDESKMLSIKEMIATSESSSKLSDSWKADWIPFAEDVDENLLLIDSKGKVRIWDPEEEKLEKECLGSSFATFLEKFRNRLCSGHVEFIEEVGIVETEAAPVKHTGGKKPSSK